MKTQDFISKATAVHGDKYDYSKVVYVNIKTPVIITCPESGDFLQTPASHLAGKGHPKCNRMTTEEFINRAREAHGEKYDYSKVVYANSSTKVTITCPAHGDFTQSAGKLVHGAGCPRCSKEAVWTKDKVLEAARRCKTRNEFSRTFPGASIAARKCGFIDECHEHMHTPRNPSSRALIEARNTTADDKEITNVGGIKVGAGIKFFRLDIEDMDYLDRIGVLELIEDVSLGKASADPMKAYEGTVTAINNDGTATVELSNYDEDSHYEDGLGSVRDVDFDFLFVIS